MMMPRIREEATAVMEIFPKFRVSPPIPEMRIAETTKRFRFAFRSTVCTIFKPLTAMKPYSAMQTPPMTQEGMEFTKATNGDKMCIRDSVCSVS